MRSPAFFECPLRNVFNLLNFEVPSDNLKSYDLILILNWVNHNVEEKQYPQQKTNADSTLVLYCIY